MRAHDAYVYASLVSKGLKSECSHNYCVSGASRPRFPGPNCRADVCLALHLIGTQHSPHFSSFYWENLGLHAPSYNDSCISRTRQLSDHTRRGKCTCVHMYLCHLRSTLLKMGCYYYSTTISVSLLGHVSKIVSILLSKLSNCPSTDTSLCYCNYPFLTVIYMLCGSLIPSMDFLQYHCSSSLADTASVCKEKAGLRARLHWIVTVAQRCVSIGTIS